MARILLVDDDDANRLTLAVLLEDEHEVVEAGSLAEARSILEDGAFALVLLDLNLGDGLGSELVPELRTRRPRPKVLMLTGAGEVPEGAGVDGVIRKGDAVESLLAVVRGAI